MASQPKHWMQNLHLKKGALHRELHVPAGKKIPVSKLDKAAHSTNALEAHRAALAETFAKAHHGK